MEDKLRRLFERASVTKGGGILLGRSVVADGFWPRRKARIVTHAHSDHTIDISKSMSAQGYIAATPVTFTMMKYLGHSVPRAKRKEVEPGSCFKIDDERICFIRAEHIPGSVQVLVENENGFRVLYTGDFKNPGSGTPIVEDLDVLIVDATYGDPRYVRPSEAEVEEALVDIIEQALSRGEPVKIYAYYGKIQEVMQLLRRYGIDVPFLASGKIFWMSKALEAHGYCFGDLYNLSSQEGKEILKGDHIHFVHFNRFSKDRDGNYVRIKLDGWLANKAFQKIGRKDWIVAFSDHADYNGTMRYVMESKAKIVIVDGYRSSFAKAFASKLRVRGVHAFAMPTLLGL
ncbi:hypothetical protein IPA_01430 [Ignicoccus pacificus DSM 13166]|uniref:Metallo-beta-lactamase domain-containing protein n=1 Tax=Ignicoccus pacificus DSM 13166 TaxID=940294 RepID=A0A977K910_9CREN|nr:hypothetical protein IPA_01430 [Ignicoccus pacificus DSM 13166]